MKNIEYLEQFFRKHNLSGRIKVKFSSTTKQDEYMTDIEFPNGDIININDIIFDIISDLPNDVYDQWLEYKKENNISFSKWLQSGNNYVPRNIDKSSVEEYKNEMNTIFDDVKKNIDTIFQFGATLDEDSDDDSDEGEDE